MCPAAPPPTSNPAARFDAPSRYGWAFNADKGALTFFSPAQIRTYRAAPPACWLKTDDHPQWRGSFGGGDFEIRTLIDSAARLGARMAAKSSPDRGARRPGLWAFSDFLDRLDPEAVHLTRRVGGDSWLLYCLLVRAPEVHDIARDNLGLAMLMAHRRRELGQRFPRMRRLARRKRTDILAGLGLPGEKQWVKLLRRIPGRALSDPNMHALTQIARHTPTLIEQLRHLPAVNGGVLAVLRPEWIDHLHPNLLREVADDPAHMRRSRHMRLAAESLLEDTFIMLQLEGQQRVPMFRSLAQLRQVHDDAVERVLQDTPIDQRPFGPPPLPESEHIVGLRSPAALHEEAKLQRNCLALKFWASDCYAGTTYVFRVTSPERASVAVRRDARGRWHIREFKTRFNAEPSQTSLRAVWRWLGAGNRAIAKGWRSGDEDVPRHTDADFSEGEAQGEPDGGWSEDWGEGEVRGDDGRWDAVA